MNIKFQLSFIKLTAFCIPLFVLLISFVCSLPLVAGYWLIYKKMMEMVDYSKDNREFPLESGRCTETPTEITKVSKKIIYNNF